MKTIVDPIRRWGPSVTVSVLDQSIVSGANLALNVVLARSLGAAEYGEFAIGFAVLLMLAGPHSALFTDALTVVGPRSFPKSHREYVTALFVLHVIATAVVGVVLLSVAAVPGAALSPAWCGSLALAVMMVLGMWLLRSAAYLDLKPSLALRVSIVYAVTLLVLLFAAHEWGGLSPPAGLAILGAAAGVSVLTVLPRLKPVGESLRAVEIRFVIREHWNYGRWILGASIAGSLANGLYLPLVAAVSGLETAGLLRAIQNVALPIQQLVIGIGMIGYPSLSRGVAAEGPAFAIRRGPLFVGVGLALSVLYGLTIGLAARPLMTLLYGDGFYASQSSLIWIASIATAAIVLAQLLGVVVRALYRPEAMLWSKSAALVWFVGPGILIVKSSAAAGALWSSAIGALAEVLVLTLVLVRIASHQRSGRS